MTEQRDIVERARELHGLCERGCEGRCNACPADVVRDLTAEIERLRGAISASDAANRIGGLVGASAHDLHLDMERALAERAAKWRERAEKAESALATAEAAGMERAGWQPIETAPKDGTPILVAKRMDGWGWVRGTAKWDGARGVYGWISRGLYDPPGDLGLASPDVWQPIPPAPGSSPSAGKEEIASPPERNPD